MDISVQFIRILFLCQNRSRCGICSKTRIDSHVAKLTDFLIVKPEISAPSNPKITIGYDNEPVISISNTHHLKYVLILFFHFLFLANGLLSSFLTRILNAFLTFLDMYLAHCSFLNALTTQDRLYQSRSLSLRTDCLTDGLTK